MTPSRGQLLDANVQEKHHQDMQRAQEELARQLESLLHRQMINRPLLKYVVIYQLDRSWQSIGVGGGVCSYRRALLHDGGIILESKKVSQMTGKSVTAGLNSRSNCGCERNLICVNRTDATLGYPPIKLSVRLRHMTVNVIVSTIRW